MASPPRKVAASRGFAWVLEGLAGVRAQPLPYLQLCLWFGLLAAMPVVNIVFVFFGGVFLQAGLVSALHSQARGDGMRLSQLFDGLRQPGALLRLLPIAAVKIGFGLVALTMLTEAIGPELIKLVEAGPPVTLDTAQRRIVEEAAVRILRAGLVLAPIGVLVNWLIVLAVPQAMLSGAGGVAALGRAIVAIFANLGAMLANLALSFAVMMAIAILTMIPLALLLALVGPTSTLAALLQAALVTGLGALSFGLDGVVMWHAWRDLFATPDDTVSATPTTQAPITQIEA